MANKNISILLIVITVLTFSVMSVMASLSFVRPPASGVVQGQYVLNVSESAQYLRNCSFYALSPSTANSSWTYLGIYVNNISINITHLNGTFSSGILEDSNDYTFNASCYNNSGYFYGVTRASITVDNSIPDTPTLTPATGTRDTDGSVTFTGAVNGSETTGCILYFDGTNPGSSSYTMSHSGNSCTYTISAVPEQSYKGYVTASDGTNTSTSSTNTVISDLNTGGAKGGALWYLDQQSGGQTLSVASTETETNKTAIIIVIILVIIAVAVVINKRR